MIFYPNQSTNQLVRGIGLNATVTTAVMKASDLVTLDVKFHDGSAAVDLTGDWKLVFALKAGYAGDSITYALAQSWTRKGVGHYQASLNLHTETLVTAIGAGATLKALGELTWSEDDGDHWESSNTLAVTVQNDVYKGTEGTPVELPSPEDWWEDHAEAAGLVALALTAPPIRAAFATITVDANTGSSWELAVGPVSVGESAPAHVSTTAYAAHIASLINGETDFPFTAWSVANVVWLAAKARGVAGNGTAFDLDGVSLTGSNEELGGGYCEEASALLHGALVTTVQGGRTYRDVWRATGAGEGSDWNPPGNIYQDQTTGRYERQIFSNGSPDYIPAYP